MDIEIYLGKGYSIYSSKYEEKTDRFFTLKTEEANQCYSLVAQVMGRLQ